MSGAYIATLSATLSHSEILTEITNPMVYLSVARQQGEISMRSLRSQLLPEDIFKSPHEITYR